VAALPKKDLKTCQLVKTAEENLELLGIVNVRSSRYALDEMARYLHEFVARELWIAILPNLPSRFGEARL
jgi:hypothetical protein